MKKIILSAFLLFGVLGFSRYIERCSVTSRNTCVSADTGKTFHFKGDPFGTLFYDGYWTVEFTGSGYRNLELTDVYLAD